MQSKRVHYPSDYPRHLSERGPVVTNKREDFICITGYESSPSSWAPKDPFSDHYSCGYFFHANINGVDESIKGKENYAIFTPLYADFPYIGTDEIIPYFKKEMDKRNCSYSPYHLNLDPREIYYFDPKHRLATKDVGDQPENTFSLYSDHKGLSNYTRDCVLPSFEVAIKEFDRQYNINKDAWESSPGAIILPVACALTMLFATIAPFVGAYCHYKADHPNEDASKETVSPSKSLFSRCMMLFGKKTGGEDIPLVNTGNTKENYGGLEKA